jgi:phospholipase/carboxylesterase
MHGLLLALTLTLSPSSDAGMPPPGPAATPPTPQLSMKYVSYAPRTPGSGKPPLLVMLHGAGGNGHVFESMIPRLDGRFRVVVPRGTLVIAPDKFAWFELNDDDMSPNTSQIESARQALLKFIDEAVKAFDADPHQVYLLGFSQGAMMSLSMALLWPDRFAGAVVLSGTLLPDVPRRMPSKSELAGLPLFVAHGTADRVLPIAFGRAIRDTLDPLPVKLEYAEWPIGHEIDDDERDKSFAWLKARLDEHSRR